MTSSSGTDAVSNNDGQTTACNETSFSNAIAVATQSRAVTTVENTETTPKLRSLAEACERTAAVPNEIVNFDYLLMPGTPAEFRQPQLVPTYLRGIEEPNASALPLYATVEEIASVEPPEQRAYAIIANEIYGTCPATRALIESVKDAGVPGWAVQMRLYYPPMTIRKIWPSWYRPYRTPPRDLRAGNLFKAFGIEINGSSE